VAVVLLVVVVVVAGGEDISSCLLHPINRAETAVIKNSSVFIPLVPFKLLRILRLPHLGCKLFREQSSFSLNGPSAEALSRGKSRLLA
jgi:hypothetical protein